MRGMIRTGAISAAVVGVTLACAGLALAVNGGVWSGHTSQRNGTGKLPFALEVSHGTVTRIYFRANVSGGSHCGGTITNRLGPNNGMNGLQIRHGKFAGTTNGGQHSGVLHIKGTFSGNRVSGWFADGLADPIEQCGTGKVTFSAKPGGTLRG